VSCPTTTPASNFVTETTATFQASFTLDATAVAGERYVVCAFPSGQGAIIHSKALTVITPSLCADQMCGAGATDSVQQGTRTVTISGRDWEPVGGLVTLSLCCSATAAPTSVATATATRAPQSLPTSTPISIPSAVPSVGITPPAGQQLAYQFAAQAVAATGAITETVSIAPCADDAAHGCFTTTLALPANAQVGATFTLTAQAQGNAVVAHGPTIRIVAPAVAPGGLDGALSSLGKVAPTIFGAIIFLLIVMAGMLAWLATRREPGVGRQV